MKQYIFSLASVLMATAGFAQMDTRDASSQAVADNFATFSSVQSSGQTASSGTTILAFNHKEETKGSPYLFSRWVKGTAINSNNATVDQKGYLYNYDKLNHTLLLNVEGKYMVQVSNEDVKSFTLQGGDDGEVAYERINDVVIEDERATLGTNKNHRIFARVGLFRKTIFIILKPLFEMRFKGHSFIIRWMNSYRVIVIKIRRTKHQHQQKEAQRQPEFAQHRKIDI